MKINRGMMIDEIGCKVFGQNEQKYKLVLYFENCFDLLLEKKSWLKATNLQEILDHHNNLFEQLKVRTIFEKGCIGTIKM